jgi:hypothetical protein
MAWEGSDLGTSVVNSGGTGGDVPSTDQSRKRSYAIYTDQHNRTWGAIIENKTGDPCGPLEPQFAAPVQAMDRFITINSRQRKLHIRYADIILDIQQANADWDASLREYARKLYGMDAARQIASPSPELLDIVGPKPNGNREIWEAAMQGNKWILGFSSAKPAWAEEFFPDKPAVQQAQELVLTGKSYPDAEEVAGYPKWSGPKTGWQLSDGSYVPRLDGEDKDAYKTRAEQAEAGL